MNLNLKGKTALVMGSSDGIGLAIAKSLIAEGVSVCLNSRNEEKLQRVKEEIGAHDYIALDLSIEKAGEKLAELAVEKMGHIDILVANTGGPAKNNFLDVTTEQWLTDFNSLWITHAKKSIWKNHHGDFNCCY